MDHSHEPPSTRRLRLAVASLPLRLARNPLRPEVSAALRADTIVVAGPTVERRDGAKVVELTATTRDRHSGQIRIATYPADALVHRGGLVGCWQGLDVIQRYVARGGDDRPVALCAVEFSEVASFVRGAGVGLALYLAAARVAREQFHAAITSHRCVGGSTSVEANRVWNSDRFRREVRVAGKVGWWVGPHAMPRA